MYTKDKRTKYINIDSQNKIRRALYLKQYKNNDNKFYSLQNNIKIPGIENANKINNCSSLYVEDFEIKYFDEDNIVEPKECIFNTFPERKLNPFLEYSKSNDLHKKIIINVKALKNLEEPDFLSEE